ncbi:hypothetical protein S83_019804, partial [Arachis hypogaea]
GEGERGKGEGGERGGSRRRTGFVAAVEPPSLTPKGERDARAEGFASSTVAAAAIAAGPLPSPLAVVLPYSLLSI